MSAVHLVASRAVLEGTKKRRRVRFAFSVLKARKLQSLVSLRVCPAQAGALHQISVPQIVLCAEMVSSGTRPAYQNAKSVMQAGIQMGPERRRVPIAHTVRLARQELPVAFIATLVAMPQMLDSRHVPFVWWVGT